jgi:hypothetical protein
MSIIEDEEQFSKCTQLCKPHESNKMCWTIHQALIAADSASKKKSLKQSFLALQDKKREKIDHWEFI